MRSCRVFQNIYNSPPLQVAGQDNQGVSDRQRVSDKLNHAFVSSINVFVRQFPILYFPIRHVEHCSVCSAVSLVKKVSGRMPQEVAVFRQTAANVRQSRLFEHKFPPKRGFSAPNFVFFVTVRPTFSASRYLG